MAYGPLDEHLGSDHYIVATTLTLHNARCPERKVRITDWARFRERRQDPPEGAGYEQWLESFCHDLDACTRTLVTTTTSPDVGPHLCIYRRHAEGSHGAGNTNALIASFAGVSTNCRRRHNNTLKSLSETTGEVSARFSRAA
ncbi:hypothetical protein HPB50_005080 [Hyalomma asiaticum]|uniref:Uncharacterized protein n=1 Tax=Hyalomma asiaticum TaxID=266040 RepID=A0ACB7SNH2_HYAAI|nr:hypothetical protein HPB50_005080 [Hyalomma asiaticum]